MRGPDRAEFAEYVAASWPRLVRGAVLLGCSPDEAQDLAQAALTKCLTKWGRVRFVDHRDAYVHRVMVNTFISGKRRRWVGEQPTEHMPEVSTEDPVDELVRRDSVQLALARLPVDQRAVVVLRYYQHLSEGQMATVLDVAPGTVKSRLSRALKALAADPDLADAEGLS